MRARSRTGDALAADPGRRYDVILTNPPFGKKSSHKIVGDDGEVDTRARDLRARGLQFTTSNKQLNFLQHIMTIMESDGRAAVVLPDNVLFEGGARAKHSQAAADEFDFHTLLRLPTGIFYKQGVMRRDNQGERAASIRMRMRRGWADGGRA